jgi:RsiW-degrading membrane proteinase PrsW (M82 family)
MKVLIGLVTLWILVYPCVLAPVIIILVRKYANWMLTFADPDIIDLQPPPMDSLYWLPVLFGTVLIGIGLLVFYCAHAYTNESLTVAARAVWIGALLLPITAQIAIPVYYICYIWPERRIPQPAWPTRPIERPKRPRR